MPGQPIQYVNLGEIANTAAMVKGHRLQNEAKERALQNQQKLQQALRTGDTATIAALSPELLGKLEQQKAELAKTQAVTQNTSAQRKIREAELGSAKADSSMKVAKATQMHLARGAEASARMLQVAQKNPAQYGAMRKRLAAQYPEFAAELPESVEGADLKQAIRAARQTAMAYANPKVTNNFADTMAALGITDPTQALQNPEFRNAMGRIVAGKAKAGQTNVTVNNNSELTKTETGKVQGDVRSGQANIERLAQMEKDMGDMFTIGGKADRVASKFADFLGVASPEQTKRVVASQRFQTRFKDFLADFIKSKTGAQATEAEMRRLRDTLGSADSLLASPSQVKAALSTMREIQRDSLRRNEQILRDRGLDVSQDRTTAQAITPEIKTDMSSMIEQMESSGADEASILRALVDKYGQGALESLSGGGQ